MFPGTPVHHLYHLERPPHAPDPCASKNTDKENRPHVAVAKPPDSQPGAHSARMDHTPRQYPVLRSSEFPASADPPSWREQIPSASARGPGPHFAKSEFPDAQSPVALRSRKFAHVRYATARSATVPDVRDTLHATWEKPRPSAVAWRHSSAATTSMVTAVDRRALIEARRGVRGPTLRLLILKTSHSSPCVARHTACLAPHTASQPNSPISRVLSTPAELATLLPYHFRLRQPQRGKQNVNDLEIH